MCITNPKSKTMTSQSVLCRHLFCVHGFPKLDSPKAGFASLKGSNWPLLNPNAGALFNSCIHLP